MAQIRCPACHRQIPHTVAFCPGCGKPRPKGGWPVPGKAFRSLLIAFSTLLVLINAFMTLIAP